MDCLWPLESDVSSLSCIIDTLSIHFYVPSRYLGSNEGSWTWRPRTCSAFPQVAGRGALSMGVLSYFNTESMTLDHSELHVWRLNSNLHDKVIFVYFEIKSVDCGLYNTYIFHPFPTLYSCLVEWIEWNNWHW